MVFSFGGIFEGEERNRRRIGIRILNPASKIGTVYQGQNPELQASLKL
jgi:hypothetical protein